MFTRSSKNSGLGFAIPYVHNGEHHEYLPDFIVRLVGDNERYLVLETKGFDPLQDLKTQAAQRWVRAVNASGSFGSWNYAVVSEMSKVGDAVGRGGGMRRFLRSVVELARDVGPNADVTAQQAANDRLVHGLVRF